MGVWGDMGGACRDFRRGRPAEITEVERVAFRHQTTMTSALIGTCHDRWLVSGAFLIACTASYVTLDLSHRVPCAERGQAIFWPRWFNTPA
jgi:hypothetical protein